MKKSIWDYLDPESRVEIASDQLVNTVVGLMGVALAIGLVVGLLFI